MAKEKFYTSERNVQIVLSLLKANGIRKIIASPGATNFTFVGSVQNDPFFEVYSAVDERSAAYMACGMAAESGEAVALSCTGATASRNYYPGLTEAFYRKLPVLAITSHQGTDRIGQLIPQNIDRRILPNDIARLSVELPVVKDCRDEDYVVMEVNKAMLELRRNGGGPVHINLITTYSRDFSVKELPHVKVIRRFQAWDELPVLPEGRIGIYVGSHTHFSEKQNRAIDRFCATYDAIVICDHTSGYYGKYKLLPTLVQLQSDITSPFPPLDLMVHIGEISAASFNDTIPAKEVWRVSEDGELRDPFKKLTTVFQMSEEIFFLHYGKDGCNRHVLIDECRELFGEIYEQIPELPFCNIWTAMQLSSRLPKGALFHMGVSNTRRCWNMFQLPESVESACNVGCCGIDGCVSTLVGASLVNPDTPSLQPALRQSEGMICSRMIRATSANISASSSDSRMVSSISSGVIRVHSTQIRTFSSVGVTRTAFSYALQNVPAILLRRLSSASACWISFFALASSTASRAACSRCSSGSSSTCLVIW